jgi:hypothetical protein
MSVRLLPGFPMVLSKGDPMPNEVGVAQYLLKRGPILGIFEA